LQIADCRLQIGTANLTRGRASELLFNLQSAICNLQSEESMSTKRVLSVGQCAMDGGSILRMLSSTFGVEVKAADTARQALALLETEQFSLVLVNRVFDADGGSGQELIRAIKAAPATRAVPVMLVSNFPEAQDEAVASGAIPGFGKAALNQPETAERLKALL
jgi:two-component system chemotaxis response regulator CheY